MIRTPAGRLFWARRLAQMVLVVLGIGTVNFLLLHLAPGDAAQVLAGESGSASPEYIAALRRQFGLDQPFPVQFGHYLVRLLTFDLGFSHRQGLPVATLILDRLPATLLLMSASIGLAVLLGCALGFLAARRAGGLADALISGLALLFYATPVFWVGLMLTVVFAVWLDWFPVGGMRAIGATSGPGAILDIAHHLVLPATTLGLFYMATYTRLMRASVLDVQDRDFVRTARAKGLADGRIAWRHVLRNATLPIVTTVGVQVGSILGGAVLVETVFSWPGLGRLAFEALFQRDLNLLLGILFLSSILVGVANLAVDLAYARLDPRIGLQG